MKYVKILGLLAVAAAALMAFAGSASAATLTSPENVTYTGEIHATSEGHAKLENPVAKIECHSTVKGTVEKHGTGVTVGGAISELLWGTEGSLNGKCTNSWHVTTVTAGSLEVHYKAPGEGTLTSTGATVDTTRLGVTCTYRTNETHIGTLTDSSKTVPAGGTATLHVSASIPLHSESSGLCGSGNAKWEGSYSVLTPMSLWIDQ